MKHAFLLSLIAISSSFAAQPDASVVLNAMSDGDERAVLDHIQFLETTVK